MVGNHLELAAKQSLESWLPMNPQSVAEIRSRLEVGGYGSDLSALLNDVRKDISLYLYCLKELSPLKPRSAPDKVFEAAGIDGLHAVLIKSSAAQSAQPFTSTTALQAKRLQEALISASTAQTLADKSGMNSEDSFACGVMRQLGLLLIAWNYPHVYSRAMTSTASNKQIDIMLHKTLGFSPALLGISVARDWELAPEVRHAMGDTNATSGLAAERANQAKQLGEQFTKFCKIGEALARANDPEHYPNATTDWKTAEQGIREILGPRGMQLVLANVQDNSSAYLKANPELFKNATPIASPTHTMSPHAKGLLDKNIYLKHCPESTKQQITEIYTDLLPGEISREIVNRLVRIVIPSAGFDKGCVFMLEPFSLTLVPMVKIGNAPASVVKETKLSESWAATDPVATAFQCSAPIKQDEQGDDGKSHPFIAAALGQNQKAGVLYLELSEFLSASPNTDPMVVFKAIRQCFNDCLNLS